MNEHRLANIHDNFVKTVHTFLRYIMYHHRTMNRLAIHCKFLSTQMKDPLDRFQRRRDNLGNFIAVLTGSVLSRLC